MLNDARLLLIVPDLVDQLRLHDAGTLHSDADASALSGGDSVGCVAVRRSIIDNSSTPTLNDLSRWNGDDTASRCD
jgi:hypothetical protein